MVEAARYNFLPQVRCFLQKGVSINARSEGYTALLWAAEQGYDKMVDFLITNNADVNARTDRDSSDGGFGSTALMRAALKGKTSLYLFWRKIFKSAQRIQQPIPKIWFFFTNKELIRSNYDSTNPGFTNMYFLDNF